MTGWPRRLVSIVAVALALPVLLVLTPLLVLVTGLVDLAQGRRDLPLPRLGLFLLLFLVYEWLGEIAALAIWVASGFGWRSTEHADRATQGWWVRSLVWWAGRLLNVRFEFPPLNTLPSGQLIVLSRHASMIDALMPLYIFTGQLGRAVHYVLKQELQWLPNLGTYGPRLDNYFVQRGGDTSREIAGIEAMARRAGPDACLTIFPEGTYATPDSRRRILASLERNEQHELATLAEDLSQLLPPRAPGTLALMRAQPEATILIVGHVGLEGVAEVAGLRANLPTKQPVRVQWWAHPMSELPADELGRATWLNQRWRQLDTWVDTALAD